MTIETKPASPADRLLARLMAAALLAILLLFARPAFRSEVYTSNDLGKEAIPMRHFYARCLAEGDRPYWWPDVWSGFYLHAETMVGMCHPWRWLMYRGLPFVAAFNAEFVSNYLLMLVGMTWLLRRWSLGAPAALLGAGLYTFIGFNLLHYHHVSIEISCAHLPFLVVAADGVMRGRTARSVGCSALGLAALTASNILLSHPQTVWICGLISAGYAALLWAHVDGGGRRLAIVLAAHVLGVLGGAAQLLPTYSLMRESQRASVSSRFLAHGSTHPLNWIVQPLAPYLYRAGVLQHAEVLANASFDQPIGPAYDRTDYRAWENVVYNGAVLPALLVWLMMRRPRLGRLRPLVVAAVSFAALGFVLSMGKYLPLFELTRRLPGFQYFREPGRYVLFAHFSLPLLAAVAFEDLSEFVRERMTLPVRSLWPLSVVAMLAVGVPIGFRILGRPFPEIFLPDAMATRRYDLLGILLVGGAALLVALAARGRRQALAGLALLAVADMGFAVWHHLSYSTRGDIASVAADNDPWVWPPGGFDPRSGTDRGYRLSLGGDEQFDDRPTMRGARYTEGYASFRPRRRLDYRSTAALRLAGARLVNREPRGESVWEEVPAPLPRVRLVSRAVTSTDPGRDIAEIDPAEVALVENKIELPGGPAGEARLVTDRPGRIVVSTVATAPRLLVVSESYFDGWRVRVDGGPPRPAIRLDGDFFGCVVEAGSHTAEFTFDPDDLRNGMAMSATVAALIVLGLVIVLARTGRPPRLASVAATE